MEQDIDALLHQIQLQVAEGVALAINNWAVLDQAIELGLSSANKQIAFSEEDQKDPDYEQYLKQEADQKEFKTLGDT